MSKKPTSTPAPAAQTTTSAPRKGVAGARRPTAAKPASKGAGAVAAPTAPTAVPNGPAAGPKKARAPAPAVAAPAVAAPAVAAPAVAAPAVAAPAVAAPQGASTPATKVVKGTSRMKLWVVIIAILATIIVVSPILLTLFDSTGSSAPTESDRAWTWWLLAIGLCFGGLGLLIWSKAPEMVKKLAGAMMALGTLLAIILFLIGADTVEKARGKIEAAAAGEPPPAAEAAPTEPPVPYTKEELAAIKARQDQEAELAAQRQKHSDELEAQRRVAEAKADALVAAAKAQADAAAEKAAAQALEESLIDAKAVPCQRTNTDKSGCETVTFGPGSKYDRTARYDDAVGGKPAKSYCIAHDGGDAVVQEPLAGDRTRFTAPAGSIVQFFDLPEGESFRGLKCG